MKTPIAINYLLDSKNKLRQTVISECDNRARTTVYITVIAISKHSGYQCVADRLIVNEVT